MRVPGRVVTMPYIAVLGAANFATLTNTAKYDGDKNKNDTEIEH